METKEHQQTIEEHEQAVPLLSDDLQDREKQIQAAKYENIELQGKM